MRKIILQVSLLILLGIVISQPILADDLNISGELKELLTYDLNSDKLIQADSEYGLEFSRALGFTGDLYLSLKGNYDTIKNRGDIKLDEAYAALYFDQTDLIIGKQIINWGTADGINPTNNINPISIKSITEGKLSGEPVMSAQAIYYGDNYDLTAVLVFDFLPQDITEMSSYYETGADIYNDLKPDSVNNNLKNMEYALKIDKRIAGYDFKLSYFHGWNDLPGIIRVNLGSNFEPDFSTVHGSYQRVNKIGLAAAGAVNSIGLWGEVSYVDPEKQKIATVNPAEITILTAMNQPYYQAVIGSDYTFTSGIYLEGQYIYYGNGSIFIPYHDPAVDDKDVKSAQYFMGRMSYDIDSNNKIELSTLLNVTDNSAVLMPVYTRALTPVTDLKISPIIPLKMEDGELSKLSKQINISIEKSF